MHAAGEKIAMLTCYDATFARVLDAAGVECLLVGDSLGMVLQGQRSTVPVTLDEMAYHTERAWRAAIARAWLIGDLPFGSYQESREQALRSATRADAGRRADGQARRRRLDRRDRALPGRARHPGVRPPRPDAADRCTRWAATACRARDDERRRHAASSHARELAEAGAAMLVLELVPAALARRDQRGELPHAR